MNENENQKPRTSLHLPLVPGFQPAPHLAPAAEAFFLHQKNKHSQSLGYL